MTHDLYIAVKALSLAMLVYNAGALIGLFWLKDIAPPRKTLLAVISIAHIIIIICFLTYSIYG